MVVRKPGDILHESKPFASLLLEKYKGKYCDCCLLRMTSPKRCVNCRTMFYCSKECSKLDWKMGHKFKECQLLKAVNLPFDVQEVLRNTNIQVEAMTTYVKFLVRLMLRQELDPSFGVNFKMVDGTECGFDDLPLYIGDSHMAREPVLTQLLHLVKRALREVDITADPKEIRLVYLKFYESFNYIKPLIFGIRTGIGLYVQNERFVHSCCANCVQIYDGTTYYIRVIREFDTDVEPQTINLVNSLPPLNRDERQKQLLGHYGLSSCNCIRCLTGFEFPSDRPIFARLPQMTTSELVTALHLYVQETKNVHLGGRGIEVLLNTQTAISLLKRKHLHREAEQFELDLAITAQVLFGDNGIAKVKKQHEYLSPTILDLKIKFPETHIRWAEDINDLP